MRREQKLSAGTHTEERNPTIAQSCRYLPSNRAFLCWVLSLASTPHVASFWECKSKGCLGKGPIRIALTFPL